MLRTEIEVGLTQETLPKWKLDSCQVLWCIDENNEIQFYFRGIPCMNPTSMFSYFAETSCVQTAALKRHARKSGLTLVHDDHIPTECSLPYRMSQSKRLGARHQSPQMQQSSLKERLTALTCSLITIAYQIIQDCMVPLLHVFDVTTINL